MRAPAGLLPIALALVAASSPAANAQTGGDGGGFGELPEAGDQDPLDAGLSRSIAVRLGFFDQPDDGAGNPFLDETLTVIEPIVVLDWDIDRDVGYFVKAAYDYVSSASIERLSNYPEQSGASGDFWYGAQFGMRHRTSEDWRLGWRVGGSVEYDYSSIHFGGEAVWTPSDGRDTQVTTSLDVFVDSVDVIRFNGVEEGSEGRTSVAATVNWYQIWSPKLHGTLGATAALQNGFLETAYNGVVVEDGGEPPFPFANGALGTEIPEELPDQRARLAAFGRLRRQLHEGTSVELGARLYADDWGVTSATLEPRLYQMLSDRLMLRLRYRYYTQTEADDFVESLPDGPLPEFRTSDSDLGAYDAHSVGLKLSWFQWGSWELDAGVDQVFRSDGLDALLASIGFKLHL